MKVLTAEQVRALDRRSIEEFHISGMLLMESAALRVVASIEAKFPSAGDSNIVVVCGKGNNGGDGLAVARHLSARGYRVLVNLVCKWETLTGDAAANYNLLKAFPVPVLAIDDDNIAGLRDQLTHATLVVDALFGTGFKGPVRGAAEAVIAAINAAGLPVMSIDIPSGLDADTGAVDGTCVRADWTVTFAAPKVGLLLFPGAQQAGTIEVVSIGMPPQILGDSEGQCNWVTVNIVRRWLPARTRDRDANKGSYGHVALFAGGHGYLGAAQIAAEAAARTGSGLVTLATADSALNVLQARLNPVIITQSLSSTAQGTIALSALDEAIAIGSKCKTGAIGPGLGIGRSDETAEFARRFIKEFSFPLVVDADGIAALAQSPDRGASLTAGRSAPTVLTPHPGEMAKLLGTDTKSIQSDRPGAALHAAKEYNAVVVLKGDRSIIATPDGSWYINSTGNPGMATGGSGDALQAL